MAKNKKNRRGAPKPGSMEDFFNPIKPKDYSIRRSVEKVTETLFREAAGNIQELRTKDPEHFELLDTDTARRKRRRAAVLRTMEQVQALVSDVCPDVEPQFYIVEEWARINAMGLSSYDLLEKSSCILLGAAIWMLDRLRKGDNWLPLKKLLPMDDEQLDDIYLPEMYDPCCGEEMLREMVYVIKERNSDCTGLREKKYDDPHVLMDDYTVAGKQHQDVPSRQRFEAILALIDEDAKQAATAHFEEKLWEWVRRYFTARADLARREGIYADRVNTFIRKAKRGVSALQEWKANQSGHDMRTASGVSFPLSTLPTTSLSALKQAAQGKGALSFTMELLAESERIADMNETLEEDIHTLQLNAHVHTNTLQSDLEEIIGSRAAEQIGGFTIEDPYEMCFAMLALIDADSDLPWLYYPGTAVMRSAAVRLPWHFNDFLDDNDFWPELWDEEKRELYSETYQAQIKKRQAPELLDWYTLQYTPRTQSEECVQKRRNLAQIVYGLTGCILPRNEHRYDAVMTRLADYGITGKKMLVPLLHCLSILGEGRHRWEDTRDYLPEEDVDIAQETEETEEISPEAYQEMIRRLKTENDQLKKSLHDAGREAREVRRKLEAQSEVWERERQELQDFRELFFNQGQDEEGQIEQDAEEISYPYTTRKRTVVFGGHDTWLKAIRPMLPEVRFVGRETIPNSDMIRHADVVWIQSNALAHKHYYKIIDVTRTCHIPVRYFKNASAEKCARQLIEEDEK